MSERRSGWLGGIVVAILVLGPTSEAWSQSASATAIFGFGSVDSGGTGGGVCDPIGAPGNSGNDLSSALNTLLGQSVDDESVGFSQRRAAFRYCDSYTGTGAQGWSGNGSDDPDAQLAQAGALAPDELFAGMDSAIAASGLQTSNVAKRLSLVRLARRLERDRDEATALAARRPRGTTAEQGDASELRTGFARIDAADRAERIVLALQEGINAGDGTESDGVGFFLNGRIHVVEGEQNVNERRSDGFGGGFTLGVDKLVGDDVFAGVAMGYTHISTNFDGTASDAELDAVTFTGYGAFYPTDELYVDGSISTSYLGFEQSNALIFNDGGPSDTLRGDADGAQFGFDIGVGYAIDIDELTGSDDQSLLAGLTIEPSARLNFLYTYIEDYRQSGGDGTLDLSIDDQETISVTGHFGFRTELPISTRNGVLTPYVRAAYVHEFNDENDELGVGLAALGAIGAPSVKLKPQATDSHYGNFGAGVAATLGQGLSQFLDYDVVAGHDNVTIHQITAGMRFEF